MNIENKILNKACFLCKRPNRFHRVFWSPTYNMYIKQAIGDAEAIEPLVPSNDHYALINNLEYLEFLYESRTSR